MIILCKINLNLGKIVFKDFFSSILSCGGHFIWQKAFLGNVDRGTYEEHLCEIILNLGQ